MKEASKKRIARSRLMTQWTGECVCGLIAYETSDGRKWEFDTHRPHSQSDCEQRMEMSRHAAQSGGQ